MSWSSPATRIWRAEAIPRSRKSAPRRKRQKRKRATRNICFSARETGSGVKKLFVKDLEPDPSITGFFLVHEKEVRNTAGGKPYLRMELGDRTGTVEARMWDQFD